MNPSATPSVRVSIEIDDSVLEQGYQSSRRVIRKRHRDRLWMMGNLPGPKQKALAPILHHGIRTADLMDLESENGMPLDVWHEIRDEVSDAFLDKYATPELAAMVEVARQYEIPKQFFFDPILAADTWIRNRKFETYNELEVFASKVGGSLLTAAIPVLGHIQPDYHSTAMECGKGIFLTQVLANCVNDIKLNKTFIAQEDLDECEIVIHRLKLRQGGPSLKNLVRLYCWRIEKCLTEGAKLLSYLDYDARRSVTSLLALQWKTLIQMKLEPDSVLNEEGVLSKRDLLKLRTRHVLGIEGNIPIINTEDQPH